MGTPKGGDTAIQVVGHGQLFAGGSSVELHQCKGGLVRLRLQQLIGGGKGIFRVEVQVAAADEHQYRHAERAAVYHLTAVPRRATGKVGGPEDIALLVQIGGDLRLAEGVVAQGDHVRAGGKQGLRLRLRQAAAGDVLPIDHGEAHIMLLFERPQLLFQQLQARFAGHIAQCQNLVFHGICLLAQSFQPMILISWRLV